MDKDWLIAGPPTVQLPSLILTEPRSVDPAITFCAGCGQRLETADNFCPICGVRQNPGSIYTPRQCSDPSWLRQQFPWLFAAATVLAFIAVIAALALLSPPATHP
jgi:predicted amidophosphoribosyltransferase